MISFYLPFPPSVNQLFPSVGKRRIKSKKYNNWIIEANKCLNKQIIPKILNRCVIEYSFNHPDNRPRDAENYTKALTDLLVARGILQDDCRKYLKSTKAEWNDIKGERVFVIIILI